MEPDITAHIILAQLFEDHGSGILVTIQDDVENNGIPLRLAITISDPGQLAQIVDAAGYTHENANFVLQFGTVKIAARQNFPTRHGHCFHLLVTHTFLMTGGTPLVAAQAQEDEGLGLIQRQARLTRQDSVRLTHGAVAHAHGPEQRVEVCLEDLLEPTDKQVAIRLRAGHSDLLLPQYIEIKQPVSSTQVEGELRNWGLECCAIQVGEHEQILCFKADFVEDREIQHYMICNQNLLHTQGCILHSQAQEMSKIDMMRLLESLGYARAVIMKEEILKFGIRTVQFCNNEPEFAPLCDRLDRERRGHYGILHQQIQVRSLQQNDLRLSLTSIKFMQASTMMISWSSHKPEMDFSRLTLEDLNFLISSQKLSTSRGFRKSTTDGSSTRMVRPNPSWED